MSLVYILLAVLMLCFLILIHEAGHFAASRLMKIPVREFSIGFGPVIYQKKSKKSETLFSIRWIPAGGYCMYYGEDDPKSGQKFAKDDPRLLSNQNVWKRLFAVLMGPVMNFVLAFVVCVVFVICSSGIVSQDYSGHFPRIDEVVPGSAAEEAGIQKNDLIVKMGEKDILLSSDDFVTMIAVDDSDYVLVKTNYEAVLQEASVLIGKEVSESTDYLPLTVKRGEETISLTVQPRTDAEAGKKMLGIQYNISDAEPEAVAGAFSLLGESAVYMYETGKQIISGLGQMFSSWNNLTTMGSGPVGAVEQIAKQTEQSGWIAYVDLLIIISVNLGLLNLLPFPGLDGSRVVFLLIEGIRKKPVPAQAEAYVHLGGFALLFLLFIVLTYNDILRIFGM